MTKKRMVINLKPGETIVVEVTDYTLVQMLVDRLKPMLDDPEHATYVRALGLMVGKSVKEVVEEANKNTKRLGGEKITVRGFKNWLPKILSEFFKEAIEGK